MLQVLEVETDKGTEWLLTLDLQWIRHTLAERGWVEVAIHDPYQILADQYRGVACLTTL